MASEKPKRILGIGWDIGGWGGLGKGKNQAFAAIELDLSQPEPTPRWIGLNTFPLRERLFDLEGVSRDKLGRDKAFEKVLDAQGELRESLNFEQYDAVVVGIDSPLHFPKGFVDFVNQSGAYAEEFADFSKEELYLQLGFRTCDLFMNRPAAQLGFDRRADGKAPIRHRVFSPTFQSFTNNVTVAMAQLRYWKRLYGLHIDPLDGASTRDQTRFALEVYPAVMKSYASPSEDNDAQNLEKQAIFQKYADLIAQIPEALTEQQRISCLPMDLSESFDRLYRLRDSKGMVSHDDEVDAAICAIMALGHAASTFELETDVPPLHTHADVASYAGKNAAADDLQLDIKQIEREGWIYYPRFSGSLE
ncbi:MAG: hypothetical protein ACOCZ8_06480 [Bacteroidota bacterium]